ncbi:hypothetical protein [Halosimplex halobium]|uniref:hypothetical protein n=1 Tax=Halosimplex halobium TaxID=3396618 RepID=UPI003F56C7E8
MPTDLSPVDDVPVYDLADVLDSPDDDAVADAAAETVADLCERFPVYGDAAVASA